MSVAPPGGVRVSHTRLTCGLLPATPVPLPPQDTQCNQRSTSVLHISWELLPALWFVLAASFATGLFDALGSRFLLPSVREKLPIFFVFIAHLSSEAIAKTIPAGLPLAEAVRLKLLQRNTNMSAPQGLSGVLSRRLYLGTAQGLYLVLGTLVGFSTIQGLSQFFLRHRGGEWLVLGVTVALTAVIFLGLLTATSGSVCRRVATAIHRLPVKRWQRWLGDRLHSIAAADSHLSSLPAPATRRFGKTRTWFFLAWCTEACETYVLLRLLGLPVSVPEAVTLEILVSTLKLLAFFLPSNLVVQDSGYAGLLMAMGIAGGLEATVPFILLKWAKDIVWIAAGYIILALHGIRPARRLVQSTFS